MGSNRSNVPGKFLLQVMARRRGIRPLVGIRESEILHPRCLCLCHSACPPASLHAPACLPTPKCVGSHDPTLVRDPRGFGSPTTDLFFSSSQLDPVPIAPRSPVIVNTPPLVRRPIVRAPSHVRPTEQLKAVSVTEHVCRPACRAWCVPLCQIESARE